MHYPQAPWIIQGYGFQTLQLLDVDRVSALIPSELEIISILPGKTIGGVYLASYREGSTLVYNELIVIAAIVHHASKIGIWVSHIYVDNAISRAGGRELWGLPKELAQFQWNMGDNPSVQVTQDDQLLCTLDCQWQLPSWSQSLSGSAFSTIGSQLMNFEAQGTFKFRLAGVDLSIPASSPFAWLGIDQPWLGVYLNPLQLMVNAPFPVDCKTPST